MRMEFEIAELPLDHEDAGLHVDGLERDVGQGFDVESRRQHGEFLSEPSRYTPDNHGLFADRGLHLISQYAPFLEQASQWRRLARRCDGQRHRLVGVGLHAG